MIKALAVIGFVALLEAAFIAWAAWPDRVKPYPRWVGSNTDSTLHPTVQYTVSGYYGN